MRITAVLVVLPASLAIAANVSGQFEDAKKIQGLWRVESIDGGPSKQEPKFKLKFFADHFVAVEPGQEENRMFYRLNPKSNPKEIDVAKRPFNDDVGAIVPGIYEFRGEVLRICLPTERKDRKPKTVSTFALQEYARPKEFKPSRDVVMLTLKRDQ